VHQFEFEDRRECLEALADSYGEHPPLDPPPWWKGFEAWYQEQKKKAVDGVVSITLKTEVGYYEDDEEDDDEEVDDENDDEGPGGTESDA
jgi:hypothetical protein